MLVLGAAVSGRAVARLARRQGHAVTVYDEGRPDPAGLLDIGAGIVSGAWDPGLLDGVDLVVASPGFSERSLPVVETLEWGVPIWSEIEYAWRHLEGVPVIAVTGTNGKTTVTTLTAEMLQASGLNAPAVGNIGTPLADAVGIQADALVVEASSFQLRFIDRFHAPAAAILNIAADHLDWHGSVQAYAAAKRRIFERQTDDDTLVFDADDPGAAEAVRHATSRLHPVSAHTRPAGGSGIDARYVHIGEDLRIPISDLGSADPAHIVDVAAAGALALDRGGEPEAVAAVATSFAPGPHRRVLVARVNGVDYVDDSKATNPHAALAAIAAYPSVILIAGGLSKGLDLMPLVDAPHVRDVVGLGTSGPNLVAEAGERGHLASSMEDAVETAARLARPGDTVLLAPGAASFDQFKSYAHRGEVFAAAVTQLREEQR